MHLPNSMILQPRFQAPARLPVLKNSPILERIFSHLPSNSDLLSVALTCKVFQEPALNILWRSLDTLIPLLKLISSFQEVNGVYFFQGETNLQDWDRFDAYANRVKIFTIRESPPQPGSSQMIVAQSAYFQLMRFRQCLFPALEVVLCPDLRQTLFYSPLFISPYIKRIELGGLTKETTHIAAPLISGVAYSSNPSPSPLNNLILRGQVPSSMSGPLVQFTQLKSLEITEGIGLDLLMHIGTLPSLENLVITLENSPEQAYNYDGFLRLRSLRMTGPFYLVSQVLERMITTQLNEITLIGICIPMPQTLSAEDVDERLQVIAKGKERIKELEGILQRKISNRRNMGFRGSTSEESTVRNEISRLQLAMDEETKAMNRSVIPPYDTWNSCFIAMSNRWPTSLLSLTISLGPSQHAFNTPMVLGLFSNLTPFEKLEYFRAKNSCFVPTDQEIGELGVAFPGIRELYLSIPNCTSGADRSITISGLRALAELCPSLQTLQLGMGMGPIPPFEGPLLSHGLRKLTIGSVDEQRPLGTLLKVGRHIDRLFPFLAEIETCDGYSKDDWQKIHDIVRTCQSVRADTMSHQMANL